MPEPPRPLDITLAPIGSRGDVQPMLALALGLQARGHRVTMAAPANFEAWIASHGVPFVRGGPDAQAMIREAGDRAQSTRHQMRLLSSLVKDQFQVMPRVCEGADLIVGAGVQVAGPSVAERLGVPYAFVAYAPVVVRSRAHPPPMIRRYDLAPAVNSLWWTVFRGLMRLGLARLVGRGRRALGLPAVRDIVGHLESPPIILAADHALTGRPALPGNVRHVASLQLASGDTLSEAAEAFLDAGDPPVLVGFGSMVSSRARQILDAFVRAADRAGARLLIQPGWTALGEDDPQLPEHCAVIGAEPHGVLLPRVRAVVHHGGAGTTTAVARAGRAQLVAPHLLDQFYWAHRVRTLGLGPEPLPVRHIRRPRDVEARLRALAELGPIHDRARATARRMTGDGVADTVGILEGLAGQAG